MALLNCTDLIKFTYFEEWRNLEDDKIFHSLIISEYLGSNSVSVGISKSIK